MRSVLLIALILVTASCSNGGGDEADQLSRILESTTTVAGTSSSTTSTVTSTTAAATTSTTATTMTATTVTTIADSTEVLGDGDTAGSTLEELPLTGGEFAVAMVAAIALLLGVWHNRPSIGSGQTSVGGKASDRGPGRLTLLAGLECRADRDHSGEEIVTDVARFLAES